MLSMLEHHEGYTTANMYERKDYGIYLPSRRKKEESAEFLSSSR